MKNGDGGGGGGGGGGGTVQFFYINHFDKKFTNIPFYEYYSTV